MRFFDHIAVLVQPTRFGPALTAGVLDYYQSVFRDGDEAAYAPLFKATRSPSYADWRTYQMSDHRVLWAELRIDFGAEYLQRIVDQKGERSRPVSAAADAAERPLPAQANLSQASASATE
jgi:hypothetical protein